MSTRFVAIWFRYLKTDWFIRRQAALADIPFVLSVADHGRIIVTAGNAVAEKAGILPGMAVADARAVIPSLQVQDDPSGLAMKLLTGLAEWCIRFTPAVSVDAPEGLILDVTGCAHLWGSESNYLEQISSRLKHFGYTNQMAMADTIGTAWAVSRYACNNFIVDAGRQSEVLLSLPATALRLDLETVDGLEKLGLRQIRNFISMPRSALRRRFGTSLLNQLDKALGNEEEPMQLVKPIEPYQERLPCLEPIVTATGIAIALDRLLNILCERLQKEEKGLRNAVFRGYRLDGKIEKLEISTIRPTANSKHLFKLFEIKISTIEPASGIELFTIEALRVEELSSHQESMWKENGGWEDYRIAELLDRISGKFGAQHIHRFLPDEHHWPERSFKRTEDINEAPAIDWEKNIHRPIHVLAHPAPVEVTAPVPDYPPMLFRYKGLLHKIVKADGPERIEQEWWIRDGQHRDYYCVEDEDGKRYWLFRSGHYDSEQSYQWFLHGFFA
jgi:protein ImuB